MTRRQLAIAVSLVVISFWAAKQAAACPFCSAVAQTFSEEIDSMDVVVVGKLIDAPPPKDTFEAGDELPKATFEVTDVLKGQSHLADVKNVKAVYFGAAQKGSLFLLMAVDPPRLNWSTPLALTPRAREYLMHIVELPRDYAQSNETYAKRMEFFLQYLEDDDQLMSRDSYDEFARAPYAVVHLLKDKFDHERIVSWIKNPDIPASRRRLYLTMLGICGSKDDLPMLEELLVSTDRKQKAGLDALIAAYLTLKGEEGMDRIEDLFLKDEHTEYTDTYAAIMALRFHGTEGTVVSQPRILKAFRLLLEHPKLADLVIPDLARWQDWDSMPRLVKLFKDSDEKTTWVRVPIINYLRACPLAEAQIHLKELEKIDPVSFRRATSFFPQTAPQPPADKTTSGS